MSIEKKCSRCGVVKPLSAFSLRRVKSAQKPRSECRECSCILARAWQQKNTAKVQATAKTYRTKNHAARIAYEHAYYSKYRDQILSRGTCRKTRDRSALRTLKMRPCTDCGQTFDPVCMDFDHTHGQKRRDVSSLVGYAPAVLSAELSKVELVCANCHRSRSLRRKGGAKTYADVKLAAVILQLKSAGCSECRQHFATECLDFDHIDPKTKKRQISSFRHAPRTQLPALLAELAKCRLLCACCHRLKTHGISEVAHDVRC
mgnify:CR=1 FL=1